MIGGAKRLEGIFVGSRKMLEDLACFVSVAGIKPAIDRVLASTSAGRLRAPGSGSHFGKVVIRSAVGRRAAPRDRRGAMVSSCTPAGRTAQAAALPAAIRRAMTTKTRIPSARRAGFSVAAYDGRFLKIRNDTVRLPNGNTSTREYVVHPGAVVVIPLLDDGRVLLERQFRYPIGRVMTEFPAGKLDPARSAGLRQARAAGGNRLYCRARAHAGALHLAIAYSTEIIHIFFARGLRAGPRQLDQDEFLT